MHRNWACYAVVFAVTVGVFALNARNDFIRLDDIDYIAQNGNTSGGSQVTVHLNPDKKSTGLFLWKTGTPVAVVEKQDSYVLVEGKGCRGWVHEKYLLLDEQETSENNTEGSQENGQKIDEGKQVRVADDEGGPGSDAGEGW